MSLGLKTILLFSVLGVLLSVGGYAVQRVSVVPAFEAFELSAVEERLERVRDALASTQSMLEVMNSEYAYWTETYEYALGSRPGYVEDNLLDVAWPAIDLHLFLIFDAAGRPLYQSWYGPLAGKDLDVRAVFKEPISPEHPLLGPAADKKPVGGLLRTSQGLVQLSAYPIVRTDGSGPVAGTLVVGQLFSPEVVRALGRRATALLNVYDPEPAALPEQVRRVAGELAAKPGDSLVILGEELASGYFIPRDLHGAPAALFEVSTARTVAGIGADALRTSTLVMVAASILFILAAWLLSRRFITGPILELTQEILRIRETGELKFESQSDRADEVGILAKEFSALTAQLETARAELENARDEALVMSQAKSDFLARMSHEIRTPMNGVLGMTELLQSTRLDDKQERFARTIYDSATALLDIINDILDFSKIEAGKIHIESSEFDVRLLVEETVESFAGEAQRKGLELLQVIEPEPDTRLLGDSVRIRQVLTNLIGNAIKFTDSGEVLVRVSCGAVASGEQQIRFAVQDTGRGINPEKQALIFESFMQEDSSTTRVYGGTGLGLAISQQLVALMGGELELESAPGQGSRFFFDLSLATGGPLDSGTVLADSFLVGTRVLIVDDNATNREILMHQLTRWKARPTSVNSAAEALVAMAAALEEKQPYDLAILDMHMPHTDGLQLAEKIRDNPDLASLRLVILSSVAEPLTERRLQELDIDGQLAKPIQQARLYRALNSVMSRDTGASQETRQGVAAAPASLSGRVLLAEDNPVNQAVAVEMLAGMGLGCVTVDDGIAAVEAFLAGGFDAILMDCQMPVMDGLEATRVIRQREAAAGTGAGKIPIVALTAHAVKGDRESCLAAGMDDYVSKPYTREQLHAVLAPIMRSG